VIVEVLDTGSMYATHHCLNNIWIYECNHVSWL